MNAVVTESDAYDPLAIKAVHASGMRFYAGVACFSDHASNFQTLAARPELWPVLESGERRPQMEWYIGITPTDRGHQESVLRKIDAIATRYEIDGLFLDFVRWPLHWEIELRPGRDAPLDSSFDAATLAAFAAASGIEPPWSGGSTAESAAWILRHHAQEWVDFKCRVIADFVADARATLQRARSALGLGAFLVPDGAVASEALTGQRLEALAPLLDWAAPMLYQNILLQPPSWIGAMVDKTVRVMGRKTLPVVQADSNNDPAAGGDWGPPMDALAWQRALAEIGGRSDIAGFIVFPGQSLLDTARGRALSEILEGR
ncbi:MAG TPA: hypothetical protein VFK86_19750 [Bauldia sp.]|nr:hypothetical protein [Bauldia sp.]